MIGSLLALVLLAQQPSPLGTGAPLPLDSQLGEPPWAGVFTIEVEEAAIRPKVPAAKWVNGGIIRECDLEHLTCEWVAYDADQDLARRVRVKGRDKDGLSRGSGTGRAMAAIVARTPGPLPSAEPNLKLIHASSMPSWLIEPPPNEELIRFWQPARAQQARATGAVVLDCRVGAGPNLEDCQLRAEYPQGYGFGASARTLIRLYRVDAQQGAPPAGARANIRIDFPTPPIPDPPVTHY